MKRRTFSAGPSTRIVVADPAKSAPDSPVPDGDCLVCKIACAAAVGMPVLPAPEATAEFIIYPRARIVSVPLAEIAFARTVLFPSDLPSRAPPAALI